MSIQTKVPVVIRRVATRYTDIRDELEDFCSFIQDICCDISEVVDEIDNQLAILCDRINTYNDIAADFTFLSDNLPSRQPSPVSVSSEEELPFPSTDCKEEI